MNIPPDKDPDGEDGRVREGEVVRLLRVEPVGEPARLVELAGVNIAEAELGESTLFVTVPERKGAGDSALV